MIAVMSGMFLAALDQTIVGTALPKILSEFNALKELSWVVTAYLLTSTITVPIAGKLSDLYGRRKILLAGIVVFVIASLLCGAAQNIEQMIAFRALQGIGGGILFAGAFTVIGDLFAARERGKWQGIFGAVFGLSSLIGPLLGGYFSDANNLLGVTTNWRWAFLINIPIGIASFALIARYLPTIVSKKDEVIDYLGAGLLSMALGSLVIACSLGGTPEWEWASWRIIGLFAVAAVSTAAFIWAELKAKDPIIPMRLFKVSAFATICGLMLLFGAGFFGAIIYVPTFAQQVLNFSATNSGVIILPMVIGLTIASIAMGQIVHKTGKYKLIVVAGLIVSALGILSLAFLNQQSGYWDLAWRMALTGFGMGMAMPIFNLAAQNSVDQKDLGVATSSVQLFRSIGGTVGLAIFGGIMNNALAQKLTSIHNEPFVQLATQNGQGQQFANFDINSIQAFLSPQAQQVIVDQLKALPVQAQQMATEALGNFVHTLQGALSSSITEMFMISAIIMGLAVIISLFLKEVPLVESHDDTPPAH